MDIDGIILIDKPKGWTSHDVVAKIRGILKKQVGQKIKVGHTGTLDPLATGLMIIVVGKYCKRAQEFSKLNKTYEVTMKLGETSSTGDDEGIKTKFPGWHSENEIEVGLVQEVLRSFVGEIWQVPPAYSAVKVDGVRAYKLARAGKEVKIEPRKVTIYKADLTDFNYPFVKFTADVSSGTYIRALVEAIGKKLASGAYMSDLTRTQVGEYKIYSSTKIPDITIDKIAKA